MMNRIVPTILTDTLAELERLIRSAETFTDYVQIDIMDGEFAPSKSIGAEDVKTVAPKVKFEVDLMVNNPAAYIDDFAGAGAVELDFYVESRSESISDLIIRTKNLGQKVGLTTLPETPLSAVEPYAEQIDSIRFFSGHLGYYGGEFNKSVLEKVRQARAMWPNMTLAIDGGVSLENIKEIKEAGVNYFAVGSRIMKTDNPAESYNRFKEAIA